VIRVAIVLVAGILGACVGASGSGVGAVDEIAGPPAPFPECEADAYAFAGETTLRALGLDEIASEEQDVRVGSVWVTATPVDPESVGARDGVPMERWFCIEWPDGSGMSGPVDDAWRPPGDLAIGGGEGAPPIGSILLAASAVIVVAIGSWLAFRRQPGEHS
jgi:hypothetical protein